MLVHCPLYALVLVQNVHNNIILEVNGVGTVIMEWHGGFGGEIVVQCPMHGGEMVVQCPMHGGEMVSAVSYAWR